MKNKKVREKKREIVYGKATYELKSSCSYSAIQKFLFRIGRWMFIIAKDEKRHGD
jgi:hypothetical protein